jgi:hypothetical protein
LQNIDVDDPAWPSIIDDIGTAGLLKAITNLRAVFAIHCAADTKIHTH